MTNSIRLSIQQFYKEPWYNSILDSSIFWGLVVIILIVLIYRAFDKQKGEYHSQWSQLIPSFKYSTKEFYDLLHKAISDNQIDNIKLKIVSETKGGALTNSRAYYRIRWEEYDYYVCAAPFGDGFFISWWLFNKQRKREKIVSSIPVIGTRLLHFFFPKTMYRLDTAGMFMTYCQSTILKVVDEITKDSGVRLSESERKPVLKDIFKR